MELEGWLPHSPARHLSLSWAKSIQSMSAIPLPQDLSKYYPPHLRQGLPSGLFPTGFLTKTLYTPLPSRIRAICPTSLILLDLIIRTIFGNEYRLLNSSLCSFFHSPVPCSLLGPNIFLSTLFSDTLSLRFSLNMSDQVSYPHKTTGKIIFLYIYIYHIYIIIIIIMYIYVYANNTLWMHCLFWVISVYFNIRNTLPKSGTFLLVHPVYIYIYVCVCVCVCVC